MPIEQHDFSAGWIPSDDAYNGRKNGMLKMSNLTLDENGVISLARGNTTASGVLAARTHSLFSRYLGSDIYRYASLTDGSVLRDKNKAATFATSILTGGSTSRSEAAAALNQVFIVSGTKYVKDDGTNHYPIGLPTPSAPTVATFNTPSQLNLENLAASQYTNWNLDVGTYGGSGANNVNGEITFEPDATSFIAVLRTVFSSPKDTTVFPNGGTSEDTDLFQFFVYVPDATQLLSVTVNLLAADPTATPAAGISYYTYTWNPDNAVVNSNIYNLLQAKRSDFTFNPGGDQNIWTKIKAIQITFTCASQIANPHISVTGINFQGGSLGSLNGDYIYYAQNVYNTGAYEAASAISAGSTLLTVVNGITVVTPPVPADAQTNQVNIYRQEKGSQALPTLLKSVLTPYAAFHDGLSDANLLTNSGVTANFFLKSVQAITDPILSIVGLYFARMLYFTANSLYISDYLDPDVYDSRYTLSYSGNAAEIFLWAKKVSNSVVYIGTNYDIYSLTGTLAPLPDGTIDAVIRPLGVAYPPVSRAVAVEGNSVIYMASDGWRIDSPGLLGDSSNTLTGNIDLLFKGFTRYGLLPISIGFDDINKHRCVMNKGKFYTISSLSNGDILILVYDLLRKYWYPLVSAIPTDTLFTEEDGTLLGSFTDKIIRVMDDPSTNLWAGASPSISLLSAIFDGGTGMQRKDTYSFKIKCDTGSNPLVLKIYKDGVSNTLANLSSNGVAEVIYDANSITLGKNYQLSIEGATNVFKLYYFQLEYQDRPIQVTSLRLAPTNLGTSARKRAMTFPPLVIDTLGNNITFHPLIDGVVVDPISTTINTSNKQTVVPLFNHEVLGVDFGGSLSGGLFEYYGLNEVDWVSEKLPPRVAFLIVTEDNEGTISEKRRRTFPFVINTFGTSVTVSPIVDGTTYTSQSFTTTYKQSCVYYFSTDVKGIDYRLQINGNGHVFEFYGILKAEDVQILPVGKIFDQVGPFEFLRQAYLERFRTRLLTEGTSIDYNVFADDVFVHNDTFVTVANNDQTYEVVVPKGISGTTMRVEFSGDAPFHRYSAQLKVRITGGQADGKWVSAK